MNEKIRQLKEIIDGTDNLVFFGGAGVSTESGIPDFRSTDGLYSMKYDYPPETIVAGRKACSCWITCGMDWELYPWLIRACGIISGR